MSRPTGSTRSYIDRGRDRRQPIDDPNDVLHGLLPFVDAADRAVREHPKDTWRAALAATRERALQEHNPVFAEYAEWALRERLFRGKDVEEAQRHGSVGGRKAVSG